MSAHFKTSITVRYAETDRMGVAYYANYFVWFEIARTEFLKNLGVSYADLEKRKQVFMMVVEASCNYKRPVTYDQNITVDICVRQVRNTSMSFEYKINNDGVLIAEGMTAHVFTDKSLKPVRIPEEILKVLG